MSTGNKHLRNIAAELKERLDSAAELHDRRDKPEKDLLVAALPKKTHDDIVAAALRIKEYYPFEPVRLQLDPDRPETVLVEQDVTHSELMAKARAVIERGVYKKVEIPTWSETFSSMERKIDEAGDPYTLLIARSDKSHTDAATSAVAYKITNRQKGVRFRLEEKKPIDVLVTVEDTPESLLTRAREAVETRETYHMPFVVDNKDGFTTLVGRKHGDGRNYTHEEIVEAVADYALRHPHNDVKLQFAPNDLVVNVGAMDTSRELLERTREVSHERAEARSRH